MAKNMYCPKQVCTTTIYRKHYDDIQWHPRGELIPPNKTHKDKSKYNRKVKHKNKLHD